MTMDITNAKYTEDGNITALVDGVQMSIPADAGNRHYAAMLEQGIEPEAYVEPAPTADQVRAERDSKLADSDWTQVADAPVDQAAWSIYRQELRDVPQQAGFPESVTWPVEPWQKAEG